VATGVAGAVNAVAVAATNGPKTVAIAAERPVTFLLSGR
jgi:hypothetical protein